MPELPEVEVARRAIEPHVRGRLILGAACRSPMLRQPLDPALGRLVAGRRVGQVRRRGKYLLLECEGGNSPAESGWLIIHLGMSGSLRICPVGMPAGRHDHFDLEFQDSLLRFCDPRRFGLVVWHPDAAPESSPLLARLGPEPFDPALDGRYLHRVLAHRSGPIKPVLMDNAVLVGVGNIYASESLFRAGVSPLRAANRVGEARCERLLVEVRETLAEAIAAGGSSLRDYVHPDGGHGCFQTVHRVYERAGETCLSCGATIRQLRQAGRSTYYCPRCQH